MGAEDALGQVEPGPSVQDTAAGIVDALYRTGGIDAVAVIVNLPEHCVATSTSNKGRLVLNNTTLEGIWRGTITKWSDPKIAANNADIAANLPDTSILI